MDTQKLQKALSRAHTSTRANSHLEFTIVARDLSIFPISSSSSSFNLSNQENNAILKYNE